MSSTYLSLHYHLVFSTKDRRPLIDANWRDDLQAYLGGTVRGLNGVAESAGGTDDHVHLLVGLNSMHTLADFVRELKKASSVWASEKSGQRFAWQEGYAAFTVSWTHLEKLKTYIATQEEHHRERDFVTELKHLFARNGVEYDPKYLL